MTRHVPHDGNAKPTTFLAHLEAPLSPPSLHEASFRDWDTHLLVAREIRSHRSRSSNLSRERGVRKIHATSIIMGCGREGKVAVVASPGRKQITACDSDHHHHPPSHQTKQQQQQANRLLPLISLRFPIVWSVSWNPNLAACRPAGQWPPEGSAQHLNHHRPTGRPDASIQWHEHSVSLAPIQPLEPAASFQAKKMRHLRRKN